MKTYFCAIAGLVAAGVAFTTPAVQATVVTAQEQITLFNEEDFAYSLGGPEPSAPVDGFQLRGVNVNQLAALEGQGISMALVNLDACAINLPHIHPRATEMLYTIEGRHLRVAFVEENGGEGAVVNDLVAGDVAFFPQGLIHYQQNLDCEPATFLAAFNSEDPGVAAITTRFFELPSEAVQASLNVDDPTLEKLIEALPEAPATARLQCLQRCGLLNDDSINSDSGSDDIYADSDFDSDSDDVDSRDSDSGASDSGDSVDSDSSDSVDSDSSDSVNSDSSDSVDSDSNSDESGDSDSDSGESVDSDSGDSDSDDSGDSGDSDSGDSDSGDSIDSNSGDSIDSDSSDSVDSDSGDSVDSDSGDSSDSDSDSDSDDSDDSDSGDSDSGDSNSVDSGSDFSFSYYYDEDLRFSYNYADDLFINDEHIFDDPMFY